MWFLGTSLSAEHAAQKKALLRSNLLSLEKALTAGKTQVLILQRVHPQPVKVELIQSFSGREAQHSREWLPI